MITKRLKQANDHIKEERLELSDQSILYTFTNVLKDYKEDLNDLIKLLWDDVRPVYTLYGKPAVSHRTQRFYGVDEQVKYSFTGSPAKTYTDIHPLVKKCMDYVNSHLLAKGYVYNGALVNLYKSGEDYIGMHSDNESDMIPGAPIFSFSFGYQRTFVIEPRNPALNDSISKIKMPDNSLIVMTGKMQQEFKHGVPKLTKKEMKLIPKNNSRINITVRCMKTQND